MEKITKIQQNNEKHISITTKIQHNNEKHISITTKIQHNYLQVVIFMILNLQKLILNEINTK